MRQSLSRALKALSIGSDTCLNLAASVLDGCPVGTEHAETTEAFSRLRELLPASRSYTIHDWVRAVYDECDGYYMTRALYRGLRWVRECAGIHS